MFGSNNNKQLEDKVQKTQTGLSVVAQTIDNVRNEIADDQNILKVAKKNTEQNAVNIKRQTSRLNAHQKSLKLQNQKLLQQEEWNKKTLDMVTSKTNDLTKNLNQNSQTLQTVQKQVQTNTQSQKDFEKSYKQQYDSIIKDLIKTATQFQSIQDQVKEVRNSHEQSEKRLNSTIRRKVSNGAFNVKVKNIEDKIQKINESLNKVIDFNTKIQEGKIGEKGASKEQIDSMVKLSNDQINQQIDAVRKESISLAELETDINVRNAILNIAKEVSAVQNGFEINMKNAIVLGKGMDKKKNGDGGTIAYQRFSSGLDIVGAGNDWKNRKITLHTEGGLDVRGDINVKTGNKIDYGTGYIKQHQSSKYLDIVGGVDPNDKNRRKLYMGADNIAMKPNAVIDARNATLNNLQNLQMPLNSSIVMDGSKINATENGLYISGNSYKKNSKDKRVNIYANQITHHGDVTTIGKTQTQDMVVDRNLTIGNTNVLAEIQKLQKLSEENKTHISKLQSPSQKYTDIAVDRNLTIGNTNVLAEIQKLQKVSEDNKNKITQNNSNLTKIQNSTPTKLIQSVANKIATTTPKCNVKLCNEKLNGWKAKRWYYNAPDQHFKKECANCPPMKYPNVHKE